MILVGHRIGALNSVDCDAHTALENLGYPVGTLKIIFSIFVVSQKILTNPDFPNFKGRIHGHHVGIHNSGSKECQNVAQEQIFAVAGEKCSYEDGSLWNSTCLST